MELILGRQVDFELADGPEVGLYYTTVYVDYIPYFGVYSFNQGFVYCDLRNKDLLDIISDRIGEVLLKRLGG